MRGDSIRDLYAKTLALLGLGVLAGTGALVDYWPTSGGELPAAASVFVRPEATRVLPAPDPKAPVLRPSPVQSVATAASTASEELQIPVLPVRASADFVVVQTLALAGPPPAELTPSPMFASQGELIDFSAPLTPATTATLAMAGPVNSAAADGGDGFFLTGAFKRTGASILRTGAKTGASFMEILRAVNRTVRRALPD